MTKNIDSKIESTYNQLLRKCKEGNDQAFDQLVENTKNDMYAIAFRYTRDQDQAYDMCQEAYFKLYKFLPKWNFSCHIKTWLYRVVTNACIDYLRKNKHQFLSLEADENNERVEFQCQRRESNPRRHLQTKERLQYLERNISLLPRKMQEAFRLKYFGGLSLKEISDIQGCSLGTIKATIHQAVKRIRSHLLKFEGNSS